jgi:hypothetical protein
MPATITDALYEILRGGIARIGLNSRGLMASYLRLPPIQAICTSAVGYIKPSRG